MHIGKSAAFEQDRSYDDMEGNVKNFTIRDYSKKIKVAMSGEKIDFDQYFKQYRAEVLERIFDVDAKYGIPEHDKYVLPTFNGYEWDIAMLKDEGVLIDELMRIVILVERKQEADLSI